MFAKFTKTDKFFVVALSLGVLLHVMLTFSFPFVHDEYFYITIPYRLLQGDSLFQNEWHLSQLSSLFTYLPVWFWIKIIGTTDGLLLFLRYVYLAIYICVAVVIYLFFRKHKGWAVAAVILFFTQTPYRVLSLNYNSVYTICTILLALCLYKTAQNTSRKIAFAAGLCIGCCCVCNPFFAVVYVMYCIIGIGYFVRRKRYVSYSDTLWRCFVSKEMVICSFIGVCMVAAVTITFFLLTGGTINSIFENLPLLLQSSEYNIVTNSFAEKLKNTGSDFASISLGMPYLLPILYFAILLDRKRYAYKHRLFYLLLAVSIAVVYIVGIVKIACNNPFKISLPFSLPLLIFTTTCYLLTQKKDTQLFWCVWIPCVIAGCVQYIAANTLLTSLGFVLATANVAGVLFAGELLREMWKANASDAEEISNKKTGRLVKRIVCAGLCLQLIFHLVVCFFGQTLPQNPVQIKSGPCAGMYLSMPKCVEYEMIMDDLNYIRGKATENSPLLIVSSSSWMYLCVDLPIATYTTWFERTISADLLISYYRQNPDKIPQFVYVDSRYSNVIEDNLEILPEMFDFTMKELSRGVLLEIESCKFQS